MISLKNEKVVVINEVEGASFSVNDYQRQLELCDYLGDEVLYALIKYGLPAIQQVLYEAFYVNSNKTLMQGLARYGSPRIQRELTTSPYDEVRMIVAICGNDGDRDVVMLDYNPMVRSMVAIHGNIVQRDVMLFDDSEVVRKALVRNATAHQQSILVDDQSPKVRTELARWCSHKTRTSLLEDVDKHVRLTAQQHTF